jgi:hypothetical protein
MADADTLRELVRSPREALGVEIKAWIDPVSVEGQAKIARAALALRNYNGGFLVIGFDNETMLPARTNRPADVCLTFHADVVQGIVSRYASESFEVTVHFPERDGLEYPVIEVPGGVRTPVAAKSTLNDKTNSPLIRRDAVFVRSLDANGVVSTTVAGWKDWPRLVEICFDNREADIGRFVRRHLSSVDVESLKAVLSGAETAPMPSEPPLNDRLRTILDTGLAGFRRIVAERHLALPSHGRWEIAAIVRGALPFGTANLSFRNALLSSNPSLTGWPPWVDSRNFRDEDSRPYLNDDTWEALIVSLDAGGHIDYWRLSPRAEFYLYRAFQDDVSNHKGAPAPGVEFDFGLPLIRVAEVLTVGLGFARTLGAPPESASVAFAFRWTGLKDRILSNWAQPLRVLSPGRRAYKDSAFSFLDVPLNTPTSALHTFVQTATTPLYEAFDEFALDTRVIEDMVNRLLERRL